MVRALVLAVALFGLTVTNAQAATFTVTSIADSGPGTLRQAILAADAASGGATITFDVPGGGPFMIQPLSPLPALAAHVVVDGTSQPGYAGAPIVRLDGSRTSGAAGLELNGRGGAIRGLSITRFAIGVKISGGGLSAFNVVEDSYLGLDTDGYTPFGNGIGVRVVASGGNTISGNVISANTDVGVEINALVPVKITPNIVDGNRIGTDATGEIRESDLTGSFGSGIRIKSDGGNMISGNLISGTGNGVEIDAGEGNVLQGNRIGLDATGEVPLGNSYSGILIFSGRNTIGGLTPSARNVVAASGSPDIWVESGLDNVIQGNYLGTDAAGDWNFSGNYLGYGGGVTVYARTLIGGTSPGARNVIVGGRHSGSLQAGGKNTVVQGNYIGTDATGTVAIGQGGYGVELFGNGALIGGSTAAARNVISGNSGFGILDFGADFTPDTVPSVIQGNYIGVDATGTVGLGNAGDGVYNLAGDTVVGNVISANGQDGIETYGTSLTQGNVVSGNGGDGVRVAGGVGNGILGNSIFANGLLGIELVSGANNSEPAPALSSLSRNGNTITLTVSLHAAPSRSYRIEFFDNDACDGSGFGEGQRYLGAQTLGTQADGNGSAVVQLAFPYPGSPVITATATDPSNNTSAFSACLS